MVDNVERGKLVRDALLELIDQRVPDTPKIVAAQFGISRQAVNKHLARLLEEGLLDARGSTRAREYRLGKRVLLNRSFALTDLQEDLVWTHHVKPVLDDLSANASGIWHYGVTEMINNAVDHSGGAGLQVAVSRSALWREIFISDDGVGIFRKIQKSLGLADERHAVLELTKGKLTTDPSRHSGEGIFFTSRMFDSFDVLSGGVYLSHRFSDGYDWVSERQNPAEGTSVFLRLREDTQRTTKEVFDQFSGGEDYGFIKTMVPVRVAQYGDDQLVSRSQAKRLMARVQEFETVVLDFQGVDSVGQAFADEVFRVWTSAHPAIRVVPINTNAAVLQMISRAMSAGG